MYMYNKNHKNSLLIQIQFRPNCIPLDWIAESYPLQLQTQTLYFQYLKWRPERILVSLFQIVIMVSINHISSSLSFMNLTIIIENCE